MTVRRLRALLPLSAIAFLVACGGAELPHFTLNQPLAAGQVLAIRNLKGRVHVVPSADGALHVTANGVSRGSRPEAVHLVSRPLANGVAVCALWGTNDRCDEGGMSSENNSSWNLFKSGVNVNFEVALPAGARLDVRNVTGDVAVEGASADVVVHAVTGTVEAASSAGALELKTVTGSVKAHATGPLNRIVAKTVTGSAQVTTPDDFAADVDLSVSTGGIRSEFPVTTTRMDKKHLAGHVGPGARGGTTIEIKSVTGAVALRKAAAGKS